MARKNAQTGRFVATVKANEHNSAIGKTPPFVLEMSGFDTIAEQMAAYHAVRDGLQSILVPGSLASVSLNPQASLLTDGASYQVAARKNDWPEADENLKGRITLSDEDGNFLKSIDLPYVSPTATRAQITTFFESLMATYEVRHNSAADSPRLTKVVSVNVTGR